MEKVKKILEKKGLLLAISIVFPIVNYIIAWAFVIYDWTTPDGGAMGAALARIVIIFGHVTTVIVWLYYAYRLLYLYRGTKNRALWTALTVAVLAGAYWPSDGGMSFLGFVFGVISLCCWIHDIGIVLDGSKKKAEPA